MPLHGRGATGAEERAHGAGSPGHDAEALAVAAATGVAVVFPTKEVGAPEAAGRVVVNGIRNVRRHGREVGLGAPRMVLLAFATAVAETENDDEEDERAGDHAGEKTEKDGFGRIV